MDGSPTTTEPSSATASHSSVSSAQQLGSSVPARKQNVACDACRYVLKDTYMALCGRGPRRCLRALRFGTGDWAKR